jgi:alpha-L-fucosidase
MKYIQLFKTVLCFIIINMLTLGWLNAQNTGTLVNGIKPLEKRIPKTDLGIQQQSNEKLKWMQDAKFGLFIHWGLYSGPAQGEWYMHNKQVLANDYRKLTTPESGDQQFMADQYNPDQWAQIAKDAGIKYMSLTTMHHDGFALFDSKYPNAFTAQQVFGIDLVKKYIDACRKAGLKVGIYKTLINWRYPGYYDIYGNGKGPYFNADNVWGYKGDPAHQENARMMKEELYAQIKELMTKYGKIDQIFWDGGWLAEKSTDADASFFWESGKYRSPDNLWPVNSTYGETEKGTNKPLGIMGMVRKFQPDILVNPRSGWYGDYMSEEGDAPVNGPVRTKEIWEKCMTLHNGGWGYTHSAEDSKSVMTVDALKRMLSDCIIRNMNLLVNVGPDRHGVITQAETTLLRETGKWIQKVQEAIYGTRGGPWDPVDGQYGFCYKGNTIYVYLYKDYKGDTFTLPSVDLRNGIRAYDVYTKAPLKFSQNKNHQITIKEIDRNQDITVIAITLDGKVH